MGETRSGIVAAADPGPAAVLGDPELHRGRAVRPRVIDRVLELESRAGDQQRAPAPRAERSGRSPAKPMPAIRLTPTRRSSAADRQHSGCGEEIPRSGLQPTGRSRPRDPRRAGSRSQSESGDRAARARIASGRLARSATVRPDPDGRFRLDRSPNSPA